MRDFKTLRLKDDITWRELAERVIWLQAQYGDRDFKMERWLHHRKKGEFREHWDIHEVTYSNRTDYSVRFGTADMMVLFKLTWGN